MHMSNFQQLIFDMLSETTEKFLEPVWLFLCLLLK